MKQATLIFTVLVFFAVDSFAQKAEIFSIESKAIKGFDPVAFFIQHKAVKGMDSLTIQWKSANWYFATREDLEMFKNNPSEYEPQYGGYCAYGASQGYKASIKIDTWAIVQGKLYFNYSKKVKAVWEQKEDELIKKADKNWELIKDKE